MPTMITENVLAEEIREVRKWYHTLRRIAGDSGTFWMRWKKGEKERDVYAVPLMTRIFLEDVMGVRDLSLMDADLEKTAKEKSGQWRLSPEWCEWLMGFPRGWTRIGKGRYIFIRRGKSGWWMIA